VSNGFAATTGFAAMTGFAATTRAGFFVALATGFATTMRAGFFVALATGFFVAFGFFAAGAERTGALNALEVFLTSALGRLPARGLLTEPRDAFEDFAIVLRRRRLRGPRTLARR
jgi:hypothetical protein